ncbi:MAG: phosphatase PAP2 family protein [Pseudonocardiales bacterium]
MPPVVDLLPDAVVMTPLTGSETAKARFGAHAVLAFAAIFIAAVPFAVVVALVTTSSGPLLRLDAGVANDLHRYAERHPGFISAMRVISQLGSPAAWWLVLASVFAWLLYRHLRRLAIFVAVTGIGSSLLNRAIKVTVDRTRPHLVDPIATAAGKSFPSGHAQSAIVGCGILLLVFLPIVHRQARPWLVAALTLFVLLVGFSRIALGVHYFSDVIGAYLIGLAWLLALTAAFSAWRREDHNPSLPAAGDTRVAAPD